MSGTYVAWNGQPYPWPPPEGWYEGSDGRWWAPGSGPEPDRTAAAAEPATPENPDQVDDTDEAIPADQQTIITKPTSGAQSKQHNSVDNGTVTGETGKAASEADGIKRSPSATPTAPVNKPDDDRDTQQPSNRLALVAGAAALLLIGAGAVALLNRSDNSTDTSAFPSTTTAFGVPTETVTTLAADLRGTDTAPPTTIQTDDIATTEDETTATAPTDASLVADWRDALAERGIDTDQLSEEDIIDFGKSFCVFAVVSTDADEFDTFRDRAQTGVAGALTDAQLAAAINTAIVTFCPEEAERLGITL